MCLAVPGLVKNINGEDAEIDFGGVIRKVNVSLVDVEEEDYVIVHAGYAIEKLEEEDARKSLEVWEEVMEAQEKMQG